MDRRRRTTTTTQPLRGPQDVERLFDQVDFHRSPLAAAQIDQRLWNRPADPQRSGSVTTMRSAQWLTVGQGLRRQPFGLMQVHLITRRGGPRRWRRAG